ncbi:MAG: Aspartate-semialdehyde dehydrogenase [Candidatus Thorarchaeota archaeon]|nr:MAG: Aspartate-semialdehyde dehydrogenase [Candidatus Thorarchaeota archaeon]
MDKLRVGVLGATGMVGQQFVRLLGDHPYFHLASLTGSSRSAGREYSAAVDWVVSRSIPKSARNIIVTESTPGWIRDQNLDLVFSALPSDIAGPLETTLAQYGLPVFSNAGAHRRDPHVPILIPEINPEHIGLIEHQDYAGFIVTNSNCSTSGLVFGLKPLLTFGIEQVIVTTYQAVSGAGRHGVSSLDISGNVIPYIENEEEKMEWESRKILGQMRENKILSSDFEVHASCARVPVIDGHLESIVVDLRESISTEAAMNLFKEYSWGLNTSEINLPTAPQNPILLLSEKDRPQPRRDLTYDLDDLGMRVKIGRVRVRGSKVSFFLLVHNTLRGAAGASVLNAEFALAHGYLTKSEVES